MSTKKLFYCLIFQLSMYSYSQQDYYPVNEGNGNGIKFWNSDTYKIHMGATSEYVFGPVTDYSIKMNMSDNAGRGWTWGIAGATPIAGLNTRGDFQVARNLFAMGNVGIGKTNPSQKLDVEGGIQSHSLVLVDPVLGSNSDFTALYREDVGNDNATVKLRIGDDGVGSFSIGYKQWSTGEWISTFYINNSGKLGIGTTNPDEKLSVNGNIHAKEVRVDLTGWSDFVFAKDYDLPTLQEVEQHIQDKGHLKDVPSAKEVEVNGILLGDMNAKLLQKIEELMLYTIEQSKDLTEKDLKILELEKRISSQEILLGKIVKTMKRENK